MKNRVTVAVTLLCTNSGKTQTKACMIISKKWIVFVLCVESDQFHYIIETVNTGI